MINANTIIDYGYEDFLQGINNIAAQIKISPFGSPDYIVGIVRGGAVPATYLSHKLKIPVVMLHWSTRDSNLVSGNEINCWIPEDILAGKRVLLVDDIVDGGDTIKEILADWDTSLGGSGQLPMDNIQIAALHYNIDQDVVVHYYDQTISRNVDSRWVVYPWEAA